jgi:hypothetical protein
VASREGVGGSNVLFEVVGEGDGTLQADDDSITLCADGSDGAVPEGAGRDVLVASGGDDMLCADVGSSTLCGGGSLDACILGDDLVVGGALGIGYRNLCGLSKGALAGSDDSIGGGVGQCRRWRVRHTRPRRHLTRAGGLGGCTCNLGRRRPDGDTEGLVALAIRGLGGTGGGVTILATQRGR